ncbi:hypothetical protein Y032_0353g3293 [Ancylostoma ceylanicum]|uniref:Midasin n=2 Tax=Ancylostoma TaxID=29169 RepID=A0A016RWD0_9BILA|nr:hypothetical protein Y032_0353g3293 [Ancylostoma ceylanicum]
MVSKNKKRLKAQKRKVLDSSDDINVIEIPVQKRKLGGDDEIRIDDGVQGSNGTMDQKAHLLPTRESLSHQLIVAIRSKNLVIIEGPIGCGKTFLASHASQELGLPLRVMQMGDQIDSKSLFGTYHCTEVAGQFLWKPTSFSQWLAEPCLILLEDIDLANPDVISAVVQLASERAVTLPSGDVIIFDDRAHICATISGKGKKSSVLDGVPVRLKLEQLTDEELRRLVAKAAPRVAHLAKTLISIFRTVESTPPTANSRQLTSSDLLRGCARLNKLPDLSSNMDIFTELIDTWCLADPTERAFKLCQKVAAPLSITADQMSFHLFLRQPSFSHDDRFCTVGRCRLPSSPSLHSAQKHRLGHTRDVLQLMERIAVCVQNHEPVLLVGETGVGKTSIVQSLASALNVTLKVVNLSPSSDTDELISGYRPATISHILEPFTHFYHDVFTKNFDVVKNQKFLGHLEACLSNGRYRDYLSVVIATAEKALTNKSTNKDPRWASVIVRARRIRDGLDRGAAPFTISRGAVLEAAQEGYWLLIDEINLAPPESLDAIVHAISKDVHPNFRLFACMNPATDAGKRRLPASVRTRFTEFYVSEISDAHQLAQVVSAYLPSMKAAAVTNFVNFYLYAKQLYPSSYSLRTFCRALCFAAECMFGSEDRSLYEGVCMAFLTNLDAESKQKMRAKIAQTFRVQTNVPVPPPPQAADYVQVEGYWIERGTNLPQEDSNYVVTKTVKSNLAEIARITCSGRFPVLLEGETSAGKTSIVCHLARITGNAIVRINNHEHTDVQEYMGSYVGDSAGRLVFREGALVRAVRDGSWVILDELNLAPTDIIETLNRLLDDNRELFVPELNTVIQAHPRFRLFATQNPAGSYGGRKRLSRALLSRFVVLRFDHLPLDELSSMVCVRCGVHTSAATKMINVLSKLRLKRSVSGLFSAKDGLMTLRDVFRWAKRLSTDSTCDDWLQILANHGYFLLAGRCRNQKDVDSVVETLESELKRKIEPSKLFAMDSPYMPKDADTENIVMTLGMRRMLVMTEQAWLRNEAVLMVGETGGGKTSLAQAIGKGKLMSINCHERTETADLLGRLRPRENGGFAWSDGIVISAMKAGSPLLIDEISLAEDSVLERLNPLFEEDRTLLLSDAGVEVHHVRAEEGFQIIATMNPGGDYGKKELSKALRNRFTEVWSSCDYEGSELEAIFDSRVNGKLKNPCYDSIQSPAQLVIDWITEFFNKHGHVFRHSPSVRDIVACAEIYAVCISNGLSRTAAIHEAVSAVFLDALGSLPTRMTVDVGAVRKDAKELLSRLSGDDGVLSSDSLLIQEDVDKISVGSLSISYGPLPPSKPKAFSLRAPACVSNFYRIARGLLINKPILLEGAPGCGKSSTVMALAQLTGHSITRLNLSDQTDLSDLFGSDVPVVTDDGSISFRWEDGPVLRAIKRGEWVLLDEMNLASQAVLEGLNACFDHRRVLYIAELNRSFEIPPESNCRFFACQNPRAQGGDRRALPKSFVNRFTNIYVEDLTNEDILMILKELPSADQIGDARLEAMVSITMRLASQQHFLGGPFSFNLRDLLRWVYLFEKNKDMSTCFEVLFVNRMRRSEDRQKLRDLYAELFGEPCTAAPIVLSADQNEFHIGKVCLPRHNNANSGAHLAHRLLSTQSVLKHQLAVCVDMQWLSLIIGPRNCGKRSTLENLAHICGVELHTIVLNVETDAQELIGSYEQVVDDSAIVEAKSTLCDLLSNCVEQPAMKQIIAAGDITELETVTELALAEVKENVAVVEQCREVLACAARSAMRFEWRDSTFVKAFVEGYWLLIEDVNLCSAAVLDRLNSCLESEGRLVISERQSSFEPLEPHPNFRVFLCMDPQNGEISRPMRNRSVEIFVSVDQQWNTNPPDVAAVTSSGSERVSLKVAEALCSLPAEKQLYFAVLLNEMSVEDACRTVGLPHFDEMIDVSQDFIPAPFASEIGTKSYDLWLLGAWKNSCSSDCSPGLLLALLSTSTAALRGTSFEQVFGESAQQMVQCLRGVTETLANSHHPVDPRFHQSKFGRTVDKSVQRFVIRTVAEWFRYALKSAPVSAGSAEYLSRTLSKYEMSKVDVNFHNLQLIGSAVDAIGESLLEFEVDEDEVFLYCLRLFLFVLASRKPLDQQSGHALLYVAWEEMRRMIMKYCSAPLSKVMELMSKGWSVEAHQRFVKMYLPLYESHRLADTFNSEEECQRFCSTLQPQIQEDSVKQLEHPAQTEDNEDALVVSESPAFNSLNLVVLMGKIYAFFCTGSCDSTAKVFDGQRVLTRINWRSDLYRRFAQVLMLLNSDYTEGHKVSSLRINGAFSTVFLSFWEAIEFDPTMSVLSASHLTQCELRTFAKQLWRLAPNSSRLSQQISNELSSVCWAVRGWCSNLDDCKGFKQIAEVAIKVMENALPPRGTIDPVVFNEERTNYRSMAFNAVNEPLTVLAKWRNWVSRQTPDCDSRSCHPVIAALWRARHELEEYVRNVEEKPAIYRQRASQYFAMCSEMWAFLEIAQTIIPILRGVDNDADIMRKERDSSQLQLTLAQLRSFSVSALGFRQKILTKFCSFVDVSMTFIQAISILLCAIYEACEVIETAERRRSLHLTNAFPISFQLKPSPEGLESPELLAWSCRDASPMPLRLKAAVVRRRLAVHSDPHCDLEWTRHQWQKWYERNVAKAAEKDFIYRTKTEEEKDELDVTEFFSEVHQEREILSESDLASLVLACESAVANEGNAKDTEYAVALVWLRHVLCGLRHFGQDLHASTTDSDLNLLYEVVSKVETDSGGVIDVYRAASLQQFRRAAEVLNILAQRTRVIRERWPEHVSLKLILEAINNFNNARLSTTHMKMATLVENIIEQCEEWEKMADRANSLRIELADVRELLVDWKKMEVRSWAELLNRVEKDGQMSALLVSFPLFDALFKAETSESFTSLCAMAAEWISNAVLLDYVTRVRSVRCLAKWATLLGQTSLGLQLSSVAAHFEQYVPIVEQKLREAREPAETSLKEYMKIVKYNDLNLWNIKVSSQKAHTHLFKIVRRFKEAVGVQVSQHFDTLVDLNISDIPCPPALPDATPAGRIGRARQLAGDILVNAGNLCDTETVMDLSEQTKSCDEMIRTQINYQGEDEEKEKQQGYARNARQRAVAMIIKESQTIGLNARKAMTVNQEELTRTTLTEVKEGFGVEKPVRNCAGGRNACIRKAIAPNDQLGVATRKHLQGVVDYGMAWILKCHKNIVQWEQASLKIGCLAEALNRLNSNAKAGWFIDHERLTTAWERIQVQTAELLRLTGAMQSRIARIPEPESSDDETAAFWHPLSRLHSQSPELPMLKEAIDSAQSVCQQMHRIAKEMCAESSKELYEMTSVVRSVEQLHSNGNELDTILCDLQEWFEYECAEIRKTRSNIDSLLNIPTVESTTVSHSIDSALLFIQNIYKSVTDASSDLKLMDKLDLVLSTMASADIEKVVAWASNIVSDAKVGIIPDFLDEMAYLMKVLSSLLSGWNHHVSKALQAFSTLYYAILSMSLQLLEKGYINPIPKAEKQESGQGDSGDTGEGGGMGEGEAKGDAKDVTDEMEESGQIEGLQDEEVEPPTGEAGQNDKPIDVDDDFAEDLQDIDRNEGGQDDENSGEDSEEEPEPEDKMGDVDEADDQQLDPKLWDEEEKENSPKDMDQENAAADNKTEEMAAKEDDTVAADEKSAPEDNGKEQKESPEEDVENVDEREREDVEEMDVEQEHDQNNRDEEGPEDVQEEGEPVDEAGDGDLTDEEPLDNGPGDEEMDNDEENIEDNGTVDNPPAEENENNMDETEAIEQGTGGEQREPSSMEDVAGLNEDKEDESQEEDGKGQRKSDHRGEAGKGAEATKKEERTEEEENDEESTENDEATENKRELAQNDEAVEDKEMGDGEQDDQGQDVQNAPAAERQMIGAGSLDEAKQSKKTDTNQKPKERKKPTLGAEETADSPLENDEGASEERQACIHLAPEQMFNLVEEMTKELSLGSDEHNEVKEETKKAEATTKDPAEAQQQWLLMSQTVDILAAELAENLRLILEPQRASKMQGDYRTGKRLNMRRLIPYIASEYRKDRIWMRRSKKAQRDYQVLIAVDDSASMNENGIHEVTCESVCVIEDALRRCDAGGVSVCSFGSDVKIINSFGDHMMPGPELLQKLSFAQSSTDLILLLNRSRQILSDVRTPTSEQLLIIISDGRGALAQGADKVKAALSALQGVTVLFVLLDSGPKSICDLSVAAFQGGNVILTPYLTVFPFPFYTIIKSVMQLPSVLTESIRQWFEMTVQTNSI